MTVAAVDVFQLWLYPLVYLLQIDIAKIREMEASNGWFGRCDLYKTFDQHLYISLPTPMEAYR